MWNGQEGSEDEHIQRVLTRDTAGARGATELSHRLVESGARVGRAELEVSAERRALPQDSPMASHTERSLPCYGSHPHPGIHIGAHMALFHKLGS